MQDIAEAADMTQAALYWHFSSKEDILYQYLLSFGEPWYERARAVAQTGPPDQQLRALVHALVQYQVDLPYVELGWGSMARHGQLSSHLPQERHQEFLDADQRIVADVEEMLTQGMRAGVVRNLDVRFTAHVIVNMCYVLGTWVLPSGPIDPAKVPDWYADLVLRMVAAHPESLSGPQGGRLAGVDNCSGCSAKM
jgi:AcrR family transcriptional regulator